MTSSTTAQEAAERIALAMEDGVWSSRSRSEFHYEANPAALTALLAERAELLARVEAAEPALAWQPISTAPKDGTMFLCWVAAARWSRPDGECSSHEHDVSQVDFCWWRKVEESPDGGYFDNAAGQIGDSQVVTHWRAIDMTPIDAARAAQEGKT